MWPFKTKKEKHKEYILRLWTNAPTLFYIEKYDNKELRDNLYSNIITDILENKKILVLLNHIIKTDTVVGVERFDRDVYE